MTRTRAILELKRLRLNRLSTLTPPVPVVSYERILSGELLHMDIKKLARIARIGHRIHADRSKKVQGVGWKFYHAAIDDASRIAYGDVRPSERNENVTAFLQRVEAFFELLGVKITRLVITNNGPAYRSKLFARTLEALGIRHIFTGPYAPGTNGKVERFIRTSAEEWAYGRSYNRSRNRTRALEPWLRSYNCVRRHVGIDRLTPHQRLVELRVTNVLSQRTSPIEYRCSPFDQAHTLDCEGRESRFGEVRRVQILG